MSVTSAENLVLGLISSTTLKALGAERVHHEIGDHLFEAADTPAFVFLPSPPLAISVVVMMAEGATVEAGIVGSEGLVSVHTIIAAPAPAGSTAVVQIAGHVTRIPAAAARAHFQNDRTFRDGVLAFTSAFLDQVTQNAVCNRLHQIEQRLAKWLLAVHERTGQDELQLTHEFLAHMLGIHRPGVSVAVQALELDGVIRHARNRIGIRDRQGLIARACECYDTLHASLAALRTTLSG